MTDKKCKELAFPVLFPKGRFGYIEDGKIKLSPVKYFNAKLLHYSGRFESLVCQEQAYLFLRQIPGMPPYWQW